MNAVANHQVFDALHHCLVVGGVVGAVAVAGQAARGHVVVVGADVVAGDQAVAVRDEQRSTCGGSCHVVCIVGDRLAVAVVRVAHQRCSAELGRGEVVHDDGVGRVYPWSVAGVSGRVVVRTVAAEESVRECRPVASLAVIEATEISGAAAAGLVDRRILAREKARLLDLAAHHVERDLSGFVDVTHGTHGAARLLRGQVQRGGGKRDHQPDHQGHHQLDQGHAALPFGTSFQSGPHGTTTMFVQRTPAGALAAAGQQLRAAVPVAPATQVALSSSVTPSFFRKALSNHITVVT